MLKNNVTKSRVPPGLKKFIFLKLREKVEDFINPPDGVGLKKILQYAVYTFLVV